MSETQQNVSGGIGFCGALFVLFLGLRLTDHIDWAWYWVAAPLWVPTAAVLGVGALILLGGGIALGIACIFDWCWPHSKSCAKRKDRK